MDREWRVVNGYTGREKTFTSLTKAKEYARRQGIGTAIVEYYNSKNKFTRYITASNGRLTKVG